MIEHILRKDEVFNEIHRLTTMCLEGGAPTSAFDSLKDLILGDPEAMDLYVRYLSDSISLRYIVSSPIEPEVMATALERDSQSNVPVLVPVIQPTQDPSSAPPFLYNVCHGMVGFFSQEVPFACLIATVVMGVGIIIGANMYITHPEQIAHNLQEHTPLPVGYDPIPELVGRITGMVNVKWGVGVGGQGSGAEKSPSNIRHPTSYYVRLGDRLELSSGLVQLTYNSGTQVILQGPCTYEVNSPAGGFLALGKLTARVDSGQRTVDRAKPQASDIHHSSFSTHQSPNPKSQIASPSSLAPHPSPLFTVQTPTAVITDLGTEFGVEVREDGWTVSHVFRGSVSLQAISCDSNEESAVEILRENESACVEKSLVASGGEMGLQITKLAAKPVDFVRAMPARTRRTLDLVDVVAGGTVMAMLAVVGLILPMAQLY